MIRRLLFVLSAIFTALLAALTLAATGMLGPTEAAALTVETQARQEVPLALSQLELTPIPSEQTPTAIFLPLVFNSQKSHVATHGDILSGEMTSSDGSGNGSLEPPPIPNNHTFVATTAEFLDRYLSRDMLPDGRLTFTIAITAPIVPVSAIAVDTGRLTVGGLDYMVAKKRLAYFSMLQLHVYDVDHDAPGCPEVDLVSVNGNPIEHDLAPARLRSGDNVWDTWTISIPTLYLRFPARTGDNTQPVLPAVNEISIDVDAQCVLNGHLRWTGEPSQYARALTILCCWCTVGLEGQTPSKLKTKTTVILLHLQWQTTIALTHLT